MNNIKKRFIFLMGVAVAVFGGSSCDDQWDDEEVSGSRSQTIWEVISLYPELNSFREALTRGGYDALLQSSGAYTVLAPVSQAMQAVPDSLWEEVPGSHIALLEYNKAMLDTMTYLTMYNGKMIVLDSMKLTQEEVVCRNGILRFSGFASERQPNVYERLYDLAEENDMAAFILSLGDSVMDMDRSVQTGLDPVTNTPVYDTIYKYYNPLFERIPLNDNGALISLVLLDNETFAALSDKYWPYLKQHNGEHREVDYVSTLKIDSAKTTLVARTELVCDLTCRLKDANPGSKTFRSIGGIELDMSGAILPEDSVWMVSNGNIRLAKNVNIRIKDNKIKDVYIQGEDYYATNENYVFTRIVPSAMGGRDVVLCGADTMRTYAAYYVDSLGNMTDSVIFKHISSNYGYVGTSFSSNGNPQLNYAKGGSYLAYKAPLFSCSYKIYWRSVDDRAHHCAPDTTAVNYPKYLENKNYPCGGVLRNVQKLYLSQPGDLPLAYNNAETVGDFVLNCSPNNIFNSTFKNYRCMAGYDPDADLVSEVGKNGGFARLGVNAGYALDDPSYETPLIWCETAKIDQTSVFYTGIVGVSTNERFAINQKTGKPTSIPKDIFYCMYEGDATVFVTNAPFNQTNTTTPSASKVQPHGSIYLDYIHFVPDIDE